MDSNKNQNNGRNGLFFDKLKKSYIIYKHEGGFNMKEYYCLVLNNCYEKGVHWVCLNHFSVFPNIIKKDLTDLDLIESELMGLDDTIASNEETYHILGSFPIFGEILADGKMHDVITGKVIPYAKRAKEANGLSYNAKYKANRMMVEELLTLLDDESKKRYVQSMDNLESYSNKVFHNANNGEKYFSLKLNNAPLTPNPIIAKEINGEIIDVITKEKINLLATTNIITSKLSARVYTIREISEETAIKYQISIIDAGITKYINYINDAKNNSISGYNRYVSLNKDHIKVKRKIK